MKTRVSLVGDDGPRTIETVAIETIAWMRRPGMPRIALEIRMAHRLGYEFVQTARLIVRGPEGEIPITVSFDPETRCPAYCTADRYKAKGPKVGWTGTFSDWRRFAPGVLAPGRFHVKWADEPYPWIEIRTRSVSVNAPVDDRLRLGRIALSSAERGRQGRARAET